MNLVGDLERLFATSLYPLRVPIAIGVAIGLIGLLAVARRRGWLVAARRHPGRTGTLAVVGLAFGMPIAWYLASPLVIRTELHEPFPVALAQRSAPPSPSVVVPTGSPATREPTVTPTAVPTPSPLPTLTPFVATVLADGRFRGADEFHFGDGTASIIQTAAGRFTLRFEDFSVRNGPDLYVYLSPNRDGYDAGALELGRLKATDGSFGYDLPEGTEPSEFESAVIWCKQFGVLFAVAPLSVE